MKKKKDNNGLKTKITASWQVITKTNKYDVVMNENNNPDVIKL